MSAETAKSKGPTKAQLQAVHKVLYNKKTLQQTADDVSSIDVLMNLAGPPLPAEDIRGAVGNGPLWVIQATGAVDPSVLEAAARCKSIAARMLAMGSAIASLSLPAADKRYLRTALQEQAATWTARASLWTEAKEPASPTAAVAAITAHQEAANQAIAHVQAYLLPVNNVTGMVE